MSKKLDVKKIPNYIKNKRSVQRNCETITNFYAESFDVFLDEIEKIKKNFLDNKSDLSKTEVRIFGYHDNDYFEISFIEYGDETDEECECRIQEYLEEDKMRSLEKLNEILKKYPEFIDEIKK